MSQVYSLGCLGPLQLQHPDCLSGTSGTQKCQADVRTSLGNHGNQNDLSGLFFLPGEQAVWVFEEACSQQWEE